MITVVKLDPLGKVKIQYQGDVIEHLADGVVVQAYWSQPTKELEYTRFEPGDNFREYYYTDRWFNIFDIASTAGIRKGWYFNIAEPAVFFFDHIEKGDLFLDLWVTPKRETMNLGWDEIACKKSLTP